MAEKITIYGDEEKADVKFPQLPNYEELLYAPEQLGHINKTEGDKLTGVESGAMNLTNHNLDELANGATYSRVVTANLNTATKEILAGFKLTSSGALNISGTQTALTASAAIGATSITVSSTTGFPTSGVLYLQGNTNWMRITYTGVTATTFTGIPASGTGSITEAADSGKQVIGGPGVIITPKGIVTINSSGVETITLEGATGNATFAGTLAAIGGTLGAITAGSLDTVVITASSVYSTLFSTAVSGSVGKRITLSSTGNDLTVYDASNNDIFDINVSASIIASITPYSNFTALQIQNNSALVLTSNLTAISVLGATSSGTALIVSHDGSGMALNVLNSGSGQCLNISKIGTAAIATTIDQSTAAITLFLNKSAGLAGEVLVITNAGLGDSLEINQTNISNASIGLDINNAGIGRTLEVDQSKVENTSAAIYIANSGSGRYIDCLNGAYLSNAGIWTDACSRALKEDFKTVNFEEIIKKIKRLKIFNYRFKKEKEKNIRHLTPMAEDINKLFGLGEKAGLSPADLAGLALIGVQYLLKINNLKSKIK